ncbi:hypothetical protein E3P81_00712 [Wallemia ichthyophaga]|uniref:Ubiquitin-conjugating enzyme E2 6 n=1 Tax=Wallemia ichthyophaga (strain EXF-994 / CBS 113033) TaxID=1299270 RepID=R9AHE3_WALI9|nr:Ubiquitin-conjugating enzyme E2 6 [Wallemia ichthyophaga EXF-994]TIA93900.1 hypothetical protein E3P97_00713 [Wallemia ichthyophaga]EOR01634.1 Ubiquitin-conjugating enzyme E2 6 [Wallemia ichthyophaga EXF-994]TIB35337.1 hypothetical protein E3P85_00569 [Wallemia ichthyophaga]TIB37140.1 hypothetical protein E3P84_00571 [Wallemia ichthyophaga]TIB43537.1 hypothetical protein E3P83_00714 [Wallemia ichthyophaga]
MKELATLQLEGCPPYTYARPEESNILNWHFVFMGSEDSPYKDGEFHGVLEFPKDYPFSPPHIKFYTPNGRFKPNTSICTSFSDFHKDTWNPMLSVSTILTSLLSFFNEDAVGTGGVISTAEERRRLAKGSKAFNRDRSKNFKFSKVFEDVINPASGEQSLDDILRETTKERKNTKKENNGEGERINDERNDKEEPKSDEIGGFEGLSVGVSGVDRSSASEDNSVFNNTNNSNTTNTTNTTTKSTKKGSAMSRFRAKVKQSAVE